MTSDSEPVVTPSLVRCPYCHDQVEVEAGDWTACAVCLSRHHPDCWSDLGRCSSCSSEQSLQPTGSLEPKAPQAPAAKPSEVVAEAEPAASPTRRRRRLFVGLALAALIGPGFFLRGTVSKIVRPDARLLGRLDASSQSVWSLAFSPDGKRLAAGTEDGAIIVWDVTTRAVVTKLGKPDHWNCGVGALSFSPDGKRLASSGPECLVRVRSLDGDQPDLALKGHKDAAYTLVFSPDGSRIASGGMEGSVRIWDASTGAEVATFTDLWGTSQVAFSPDGKHLATSAKDGKIRIRDLSTGKLVRTIEGPLHTGWSDGVTYSPNGKKIAAARMRGPIGVWNAETGEEIATIRTGQDDRDMVGNLLFGPKGRVLIWTETACHANEGKPRFSLWAETITEKQAHPARVRFVTLIHGISADDLGFVEQEYIGAVALSPDGRVLATAQDGKVTLRDVSDLMDVPRCCPSGSCD